MFSIVMPCTLLDYPKAAKNRDIKLIRAIESVQEQTYKDWELIIIADGCDETVKIANTFQDSRIKVNKVVKQTGMVGVGRLRNLGIKLSSFDWITYLDSDDIFGVNHLEILSNNLKSDWLFYNDYIWNKHKKDFTERDCTIKAGNCGTSNITHLKSLNTKWQDYAAYGYDDWNMIKGLMKFNHIKIEVPEYFVLHIPGTYEL